MNDQQKKMPKEIAESIAFEWALPDALWDVIEKTIAVEREETDKWKWEYENLCKFATQYEQERDQLQEEVRRMAQTMEDVRSELTNGLQNIDVQWCIDELSESIGMSSLSVKLLEEK